MHSFHVTPSIEKGLHWCMCSLSLCDVFSVSRVAAAYQRWGFIYSFEFFALDIFYRTCLLRARITHIDNLIKHLLYLIELCKIYYNDKRKFNLANQEKPREFAHINFVQNSCNAVYICRWYICVSACCVYWTLYNRPRNIYMYIGKYDNNLFI